MNRNPLSTWSQLQRFIKANNLGDTYLFSPLYGLGDRAAFYAFLQQYQSVHQRSVGVLQFDNAGDPLIKLFPGLERLAFVLPAGVINGPIKLTHWVYGSSIPAPGKVFFTWHWSFLDGGMATMFEQHAHEAPFYNHKNLVKLILNLPLSTKPASVSLDSPSTTIKKRQVLLCPMSNTIESPPIDYWLVIAEDLAKRNIEPVFNVSSAASAEGVTAKMDANKLSGYRLFAGSVAELLRESSQSLGVVTTRSGICELLSLAQQRFIILSSKPISSFWDLTNDFGAPALSSVVTSGVSPLEISQKISEILMI